MVWGGGVYFVEFIISFWVLLLLGFRGHHSSRFWFFTFSLGPECYSYRKALALQALLVIIMCI